MIMRKSEQNMVQSRFLIGVLLGVATMTTHAQAVNDSCLSATNLGFLEFSQVCLFDPGSGQPGATPFADSTVLAGPEFPYPAMALPCDGYAASVTVPSNDVWYSFQPACSFALEVVPGPYYSTDTIHISVWHGPDCGQLVPLKCYTLAANDVLSDSSLPFYPGTYYLQVSSPSLASASRFSICLRGTQLPCTPTLYSYGEPTPVLCFPFALSTGYAPEAGATGSATLVLHDAFAPWSVVWSDGVTDVTSRNDLPVGDHTVAVTSAAGCTEVIPFTILLDPVLGFPRRLPRVATGIHAADGIVFLTGPFATRATRLSLFDIHGSLLGSWGPRTDGTFPVGPLGAGLYAAQLHLADGTRELILFPMAR